jgi:RNA polymerase sigma-70 factor (ECF subfamily)
VDWCVVYPHVVVERAELAATLERAIGELRPAYREVMMLRHREELSYQENGEITGLTLAAVKTNLHRARKELAEILRRRI